MAVIRNCIECGPVMVESEEQMKRVDTPDGGFVVACPNHHTKAVEKYA